jgi:hypothetical protein
MYLILLNHEAGGHAEHGRQVVLVLVQHLAEGLHRALHAQLVARRQLTVALQHAHALGVPGGCTEVGEMAIKEGKATNTPLFTAFLSQCVKRQI